MNGIEKITGRIEADAQEQAKAIAAEAEARCAEIRADYDKQAQDQYWARVRDGVKACEDRVQRMGRLAEMEARKSVLALKQEMVDAAFAAALDKICTMPQADYVAYLAKLAAQAATTGTETLVFNAKDQAACGQAVADAANALLAQQGKQARLTVSSATRDLRAGFVLQQGDIEVNCAVLHENLIESELFGYEKGAFTGAASAGKIGKIELANHGTLFLDEIGELPPHIQSKLLQLIQEKTIERVSGTKRIELDFRLLVATNRNLEEEVQRGLFRSDLFYRLNVIRVHIPPLRQRPEDILPMAHQFLERFCKEYGKQLALSPRFVAFLEQYPWPGNVRQLENLMERLVITAQNPILDITALPLEYNSGGSAPDLPSQEGTLAERMDAFEGQIIRDSYRRCGTTVAVAKELGISQATAVRKIAKYVKDRKE